MKILIDGLDRSGKTFLAKLISDSFRLPLLHKRDDFLLKRRFLHKKSFVVDGVPAIYDYCHHEQKDDSKLKSLFDVLKYEKDVLMILCISTNQHHQRNKYLNAVLDNYDFICDYLPRFLVYNGQYEKVLSWLREQS
jgi:uridine kinase